MGTFTVKNHQGVDQKEETYSQSDLRLHLGGGHEEGWAGWANRGPWAGSHPRS